jgi:hypothetical protein
MQTCVNSDLTVQTPYSRRERNILEVARETSWRFIDRHLIGGKIDDLEVGRAMSWRWKDRHLGGGKRDVLEVERETLRGIRSDVVSMGETLLDVARLTSWRWQ